MPLAPARRLAIAPPPLYAIADTDAAGVEGALEVVRIAARRGVRWIQLRAKSVPDRDLYSLVERAVERTDGTRTHLWIDDRADLAALFPVSGVHVGQRDLPPMQARKIVGDGVWIGQSTHDREQAVAAIEDPEVDLIAVGPVFETGSKRDPDPVVGLDLIRWVRARTAKPLVAIGGIDAARAPRVLEAGADSAVVLGAICRGDVEANCRSLLEAVGAERAREAGR